MCGMIFHYFEQDSVSKGHYYIDVMDWLSGTWFRCNDANVRLRPKKHKLVNYSVTKSDGYDKRNLAFIIYARDIYLSRTNAFTLKEYKAKHPEYLTTNAVNDNLPYLSPLGKEVIQNTMSKEIDKK